MNQDVYELAKTIGLQELELNAFQDAVYLDVPKFHKKDNILMLHIQLNHCLDFAVYDVFLSKLTRYCKTKLDIKITSISKEYSVLCVNQYIKYLVSKDANLKVFLLTFPSIEGSQLHYRFEQQEQEEWAREQSVVLLERLKPFGFELSMDVSAMTLDETHRVAEVVETVQPAPQPKMSQAFRPKSKGDELYEIKDLFDGLTRMKVQGIIFKIDVRELRSGKIMQDIYLADEEEAIIINRMETKNLTREMMEDVKEKDTVMVYGRVEYNEFRRENIIKPSRIEKIQLEQKQDPSPVKRVELHAHSKLSEMDGVSSIDEYIKQANAWGHDAFTIVDHNVVQAFPSAQKSVKQINQNRETPFKMIYGIEMSMVDDALNCIYNADDRLLDGATYCIFDLETTGLSCKYDHIIEFGAKLVKDRGVIGTMQMFIKPPVSISAHITQLTNIHDDMLRDAPSLEEAMPSILEFIKDHVLVAHNASFDMSFLNEAMHKLGNKDLKNPAIDTLDLAKTLLPNRRSYRLGNIARFYKIKYDGDVAHRADYDASVLSDVFLRMLHDMEEEQTLLDIEARNSNFSIGSVRAKHITILAKNEAGIKDIFELVTMSHTTYLSEVGKSNNKPLCVPRIIRTEILKMKAKGNVLIGSSCLNSEVFEAAHTRSDEYLASLLSFYDYIELQPIENYIHMVSLGRIKDMEQLQSIIKSILSTSQAAGKIVVATGDAHYVRENQKEIRDVFINAQGIGGVRHPLYIYNRELRMKVPSPKQHFRTTKEMLDAFAFLGEKLAYELVVENTRKVSDMIDVVTPVKSDLFPPKIEGCADKLRKVCFDTAHDLYGASLPEIVEKRLNKELDSIIGNGFEVVYYVSHLLVKQSLNDGYLVGSRGSVGSSFAATMAKITEVNPLAPHYICPSCKYSEFVEDKQVQSGFDLPDKKCPKCSATMIGDGQNIPFETFLGFEGDKVPDIDLNFSGEYQEKAHKYIQSVFGDAYAYRAGTIATVAEKTAFGYVKNYFEEIGSERVVSNTRAAYLASECAGVRRSTGQHPGGIIVFPQDKEVSEFTPVQFPSNNPSEDMKTTHLDYHDIEQNVLKFDILGHVDPTAMKMLEESSGVDVTKIPMNDKDTLAIFSKVDSLNIDSTKNSEKTGAAGIPEFGTSFVRGILETTKPTTFDELLKISGLSHGTDVWLNNAKDLIDAGVCTLKEVIGCRDDIMVYLMQKNMDPKLSFTIMESVRKGKGLRPEWIEEMKAFNVEDYYIDSCEKIKYMFPKAHAVAYVMMAVRIAWFKVHKPLHYYCMYFSIRCDAYDIDTMCRGEMSIREKMSDITNRLNHPDTKRDVSDKDKNVFNGLELALEMQLRGYRVSKLDINRSQATKFSIDPQQEGAILPSFSCVDGLGDNVAYSIVEARKDHPFLSKQDLQNRTLLSTTLIKKLDALGALSQLQDENQMSLFEM